MSDSSKDRRHRRHLITIHIAFLGWIVEWFGFFIVLLGSFILGHGNASVTLLLQTLSIFTFCNVLPCVYLINDSNLKANMAESKYYLMIIRIFGFERREVSEGMDEDEEDTNSSKIDEGENEVVTNERNGNSSEIT